MCRNMSVRQVTIEAISATVPSIPKRAVSILSLRLFRGGHDSWIDLWRQKTAKLFTNFLCSSIVHGSMFCQALSYLVMLRYHVQDKSCRIKWITVIPPWLISRLHLPIYIQTNRQTIVMSQPSSCLVPQRYFKVNSSIAHSSCVKFVSTLTATWGNFAKLQKTSGSARETTPVDVSIAWNPGCLSSRIWHHLITYHPLSIGRQKSTVGPPGSPNLTSAGHRMSQSEMVQLIAGSCTARYSLRLPFFTSRGPHGTEWYRFLAKIFSVIWLDLGGTLEGKTLIDTNKMGDSGAFLCVLYCRGPLNTNMDSSTLEMVGFIWCAAPSPQEASCVKKQQG